MTLRIDSRTVVLPIDNIDTDQIIPARFLTTTRRTGLGQHLFHAWRFDESGAARPEFALNEASARGCEILVAGHNFGCGSSREHAPWALLDYGIRVVISSGIADIFRSNALKNGLLPIVVDDATHDWLLAHPGVLVSVDLAESKLHLPGRDYRFVIDEFSRQCLINGVDELGYLLSKQPEIERYESEQSQ